MENTPTILAVDDSQTMQNMVRQTLETGGYRVVLAADGVEGLNQFRQHEVDAVITDINMPVMDGISLTREIRKLNPNVPILTLTTEFDETLKQKGAEAGANGWVVKPFRPGQFLDIVRQMLG